MKGPQGELLPVEWEDALIATAKVCFLFLFFNRLKSLKICVLKEN